MSRANDLPRRPTAVQHHPMSATGGGWETQLATGKQLRIRGTTKPVVPPPDRKVANIAFAPHDRVCEYLTEPTRCDGCGTLIEPTASTWLKGFRHSVASGIIYKVGGRGMGKELLCGNCWAKPRIAPSIIGFMFDIITRSVYSE